MEFGIFDHLDRRPGSLTDLYEDRLKLAEAYDRAGFFCYHLAEHHSTPIGTAPSPSVFLAALAQRTKRLRFAPLVYLLPFYHPIRLIEEICMLDQLSGGRLEIGVGRGISPVEAGFYAIDPGEAQRRYDETYRILRDGLGRDSVTFDGEFYRFDGVPIVLEPVQKPHPPFWYGVHGAESAARAIRGGFHVITNEGTTAGQHVVDAAHDAWTALAHDGAPPKIGLVRFVVLADTDDAALAIGRRGYARWLASFYHLHTIHHLRATHDKAMTFDAALAEGTAFAGTPETVTRGLRAQFEELEANYLAVQFAFGDLTLQEALRSVELFAERVAPALRTAAIGAR